MNVRMSMIHHNTKNTQTHYLLELLMNVSTHGNIFYKTSLTMALDIIMNGLDVWDPNLFNISQQIKH